MSDKPKGIQEGPPIWVESCLSLQEWKDRHKKYKTPQSEPPDYNEIYYKGGKWRAGMGAVLSLLEITNINKNLDYLRTLVDTKHLVG